MNDTALNSPADRDAPPTAPARDAVVRCQKLTKVFKDFWMRPRVKAVNGIDLDVRPGEVFGLLGPNGSGKSTTIKLILGLLAPTSGRIAVFGKRPEDVATKEIIGYLPEESYLYRFLNARETLDYYGRLFHQSRSVRQKRIDMLLEMVGLEAAQNRPVGEYSKGMQRRIGLAQALINDPKLLILDEPTTGMDPIGTRQIKDLLLRLRDRGKTILLCSHLLADVEDVCDRVSIMFGGRVIEEGSIEDLLTQRDVTTIETPDLDEKTINEIEMVLEKHGQAINRVSHRKQSLEKLFLNLVERERARGAETSGAGSGGRIAEFLAGEERGGHLPEGAEAAAILDELTRPTETAPPPPVKGAGEGEASRDAATPAAPGQPAEPAAPPDEQVLAELSGQKPAKPEPKPTAPRSSETPPPAAPPGESQPDEDVDLSVLESLVDAPPSPRVSPKPDQDKPRTPPTPPADTAAPPAPPAASRDRSTTDTAAQPPTTPKPSTEQPSDEAKPASESPSNEAPPEEPKPQTESPPPAPPSQPPADAPRDEKTGGEQPRGEQPRDEQSREAQPPREQKQKPKQPEPPPKPEISPISGESGLGLMHGVTGPDDDIKLPPVHAAPPTTTPTKNTTANAPINPSSTPSKTPRPRTTMSEADQRVVRFCSV